MFTCIICSRIRNVSVIIGAVKFFLRINCRGVSKAKKSKVQTKINIKCYEIVASLAVSMRQNHIKSLSIKVNATCEMVLFINITS